LKPNPGIFGYWTAAFAGIVMCEHFLFRKSFASYNVEDWDAPGFLPPGVAGGMSFACAIGVIVPCMSQAWYTGPIAASETGDLAVWTGFASAALFYAIFRTIEVKVAGR
jgi:purine-cytosine permease-like protein